MLDGVNDSPEDARRLARLLAGIKAKVNLIPLNAAAGIPFERPSDARVDHFARILAEKRGRGLGPQESRPGYSGRLWSADCRGPAPLGWAATGGGIAVVQRSKLSSEVQLPGNRPVVCQQFRSCAWLLQLRTSYV